MTCGPTCVELGADADAAVMTAMVLRDTRAHEHLSGVIIFTVIGAALLVVAPRKQSAEHQAQA